MATSGSRPTNRKTFGFRAIEQGAELRRLPAPLWAGNRHYYLDK